MSSGHRLEQGICFFSSDFSDDDDPWSLSECDSDEVEHVDVSGGLEDVGAGESGSGGSSDPVLMGKVDFSGVFDGDDLVRWWDEEGEGVEHRCFA